jgi:hypothetical protein
VGTTFSLSGFGKYYNPKNVSGQQFNKVGIQAALRNPSRDPNLMNIVRKGVQAYGEAQYYRHAGFGAATRHMLGMPQMPSHMTDYLRSRHNTKNPGVNPKSIEGQFGMQDPHEYEHW